MSVMPKIISAGFATCAIAAATMPAFSSADWSGSGLEWYVDMDRAAMRASKAPAPRVDSQPRLQLQAQRQDSQDAFIWAPGRYTGPTR
jgi:hypothetical protein